VYKWFRGRSDKTSFQSTHSHKLYIDKKLGALDNPFVRGGGQWRDSEQHHNLRGDMDTECPSSLLSASQMLRTEPLFLVDRMDIFDNFVVMIE